MKYVLQCHPATACPALRAIEVEMQSRDAHCVTLRYSLLGDIASLRIAPVGEARRSDELWQHTCCELFVGSVRNESYYEFNFSSSTAWAAFFFDSYRTGMRLASVTTPHIHVTHLHEQLVLETIVNLAELNVAETRLALSAVVEEIDGRKSYWALKHPSARPDFHHSDSFIARL